MDESEDKAEEPFELTDFVILNLFWLPNDLVKVIADLSVAVPVLGEVTYGLDLLLGWAVSAITIIWFTIKMRSFGAAGLLQVGAGIAESLGVPASAIAGNIGMIIGNRPQLAAVAEVAAGKVGAIKGELAAAEGGVAAAKTEVRAAGKAEAAAGEGRGAAEGEIPERRAPEAGREAVPGEGPAAAQPEVEEEKAREKEKGERIEEAMLTKEEKPPIEVAKEEIPEVFVDEDQNRVDLRKAA